MTAQRARRKLMVVADGRTSQLCSHARPGRDLPIARCCFFFAIGRDAKSKRKGDAVCGDSFPYQATARLMGDWVFVCMGVVFVVRSDF